MKFEEVLPALREGKKVRRKEWKEDEWICFYAGDIRLYDGLYPEKLYKDLFWDDWEIYTEPKKQVKYACVMYKLTDHCDKVRISNCKYKSIEEFRETVLCALPIKFMDDIDGFWEWRDEE